MRLGIRKKLILVISALIVVLFSLVATLFIKEKKVELAHDIYVNTLAFAKLTASDVAYNYDLYLKDGSFVYFNREIQNVFAQNEDVDRIEVISFDGAVLYDSAADTERKYDGATRAVDGDLLSSVQSENISLLSDQGRRLFLKDEVFVDENEQLVEPLEDGALLEYFVVPASEQYRVLYALDYTNLDARISQLINRIGYLALFGILLGVVMSFLMSGQVTRPILKLVEGAKEIAKGNFKTHVDIDTHDEVRDLGESFNQMAVELGASVEAKIYQERVTHELQLATQIQTNLVPKTVPVIPGVDVAAGLIPAEEIGGDIFDFLQVDQERWLMYLGDVTGHGVPAGIVSSVANALFYGYKNLSDLKEILVKVNVVLKEKTLANMFMTLCLMEWDAAKSQFTFASAGHEQILHYRAASRDVVLEPSGGVALGMVPDIGVHTKVCTIDFQPGDFLVIYSDGIPEAWRNEKECYGMERFVAACAQFGNLQTALAVKEAILADVEQFAQGYPQQDDITVMVIKKS